jgi:hypothetical protein
MVICVVYLILLMLSLDITYYIALVCLWGIGETTVGFLVLGIPSVPVTTRVMPCWGNVADTKDLSDQILAQVIIA